MIAYYTFDKFTGRNALLCIYQCIVYNKGDLFTQYYQLVQ